MNVARTIVLICLLLCPHISSAGETVRISTGEFAPWTSESLKHHGFTNHVISEALKLEGYDVEYTFYPWKRAFESAKSGDKFHATSYWYPSDERAEDFYYSEPIQTDAVVFFHLTDNPPPEWEALPDLQGRRIGATSGFTYTKEFWELASSKSLDIQEAETEELNFRKLLKGRIDLFPSDPLVGQMILQEYFGKKAAAKVIYHHKPMFGATGHLLFSKKADNVVALVAAFNRGLAKLKASGRFALFQADLIAGRYEQ